MSINILPGVLSHTQKVKSLYKRVLRNVKAYTIKIPLYRYRSALVRQLFEEKRHICDRKKAQEALELGEVEFKEWKYHFEFFFQESPGGTAYEREVSPPDWVVDYWDPLEKAQYPEYFARREQRKKEFIKIWQKKYGQSTYKPTFIPHSWGDST